MADPMETREKNKRDVAFDYPNQQIISFETILGDTERVPSDHKIMRVLNWFLIWENEYKEAHLALLDVMVEQEQHNEMNQLLITLRVKLDAIRDLAE